MKKYSGTTWDFVYTSVGSTNITLTGSSSSGNSFTAPVGLKYVAVKDVIINTITKHASTTATRAYIKNSAGTILETITFSGNVATPVNQHLFLA